MVYVEGTFRVIHVSFHNSFLILALPNGIQESRYEKQWALFCAKEKRRKQRKIEVS
jgi:hypothetical protein